jgi:hypothetical protein
MLKSRTSIILHYNPIKGTEAKQNHLENHRMKVGERREREIERREKGEESILQLFYSIKSASIGVQIMLK